jgi:hypothetical protein
MKENEKSANPPSNPKDRERLEGVVKGIVNSMMRVSSEKEYQKEAIEAISEDLEIRKKAIRQMAKDSFEMTFNEKVDEFEEYRHLYETVMGD